MLEALNDAEFAFNKVKASQFRESFKRNDNLADGIEREIEESKFFHLVVEDLNAAQLVFVHVECYQSFQTLHRLFVQAFDLVVAQHKFLVWCEIEAVDDG